MARHRIAEDGSWRYTNAHDRFTVRCGDVWQATTATGRHTFLCGDLQADTPLYAHLTDNPPTLMYVDPPYNSGVASTYRTKAGVERKPVNIIELWAAALTPAYLNGLVAYVETGLRERTALHQLIAEMGGTVTGDWTITYYRRHDAALVAADFRHVTTNDHPYFTGMDDEDTPFAALTSRPAGTVLDTCAGRGLTSRAAHKAGWSSISHELSPFRLAEALDRFHQLTGVVPVVQKGPDNG